MLVLMEMESSGWRKKVMALERYLESRIIRTLGYVE